MNTANVTATEQFEVLVPIYIGARRYRTAGVTETPLTSFNPVLCNRNGTRFQSLTTYKVYKVNAKWELEEVHTR